MDLNLRVAICTTCGIRVCDGVQHDDEVFRVPICGWSVGQGACLWNPH